MVALSRGLVREDEMKRMTLNALAFTALLALAGGAMVGDHLSAQGPAAGPGRPERGGGPGDWGRGRGPGGPGGPMGAINPMLLRQLDLSDAQRAQVKQVADSHRDEQRAFGEKARAARQALEASIVAAPLDESTIRGKAADIAAVEADMAVASGRIYSEIVQVLSGEQQTKLKSLQAEQAQRQGRRGH
jgi:periplasmic protein CpxP/Spy